MFPILLKLSKALRNAKICRQLKCKDCSLKDMTKISILVNSMENSVVWGGIAWGFAAYFFDNRNSFDLP